MPNIVYTSVAALHVRLILQGKSMYQSPHSPMHAMFNDLNFGGYQTGLVCGVHRTLQLSPKLSVTCNILKVIFERSLCQTNLAPPRHSPKGCLLLRPPPRRLNTSLCPNICPPHNSTAHRGPPSQHKHSKASILLHVSVLRSNAPHHMKAVPPPKHTRTHTHTP